MGLMGDMKEELGELVVLGMKVDVVTDLLWDGWFSLLIGEENEL